MTKKQIVNSRLRLVDKLAFWLSRSRKVDGLWVGTMERTPQLGMRRVEDALHLIKLYSPLHYSRVIHNLQRVWVFLEAGALAHYDRSLGACVLDERFVLADTTTPERIATTINHEATHARLDHCGIDYEEKLRPRIEAICLRRELDFANRLPGSTELQEELGRSIEYYTSTENLFSDASFRERDAQGQIEALRYLKAPEWVIRAVFKMRLIVLTLRRLVRYATRRE